MCRFAYKLQAAEIALVIRTVTEVTSGISAGPPHFRCTEFDADGVPLTAVCSSSTPEGNAACATPGVATCTLHYQDVNVTQLAPGATVRVCNPDWAQNPEQFYKVAYLSGVPDLPPGAKPDMPAKEAAALSALVQMATRKLGSLALASVVKTRVTTYCRNLNDSLAVALQDDTGDFKLVYAVQCSDTTNQDGTRNVTSLYMWTSSTGQLDPSQVHPRLDSAMLYPLLRLQSLEAITLLVRHWLPIGCLRMVAALHELLHLLFFA